MIEGVKAAQSAAHKIMMTRLEWLDQPSNNTKSAGEKVAYMSNFTGYHRTLCHQALGLAGWKAVKAYEFCQNGIDWIRQESELRREARRVEELRRQEDYENNWLRDQVHDLVRECDMDGTEKSINFYTALVRLAREKAP